MIRKCFIVICVLLIVILFVSREKTYLVPRLHGDDIYVKESDLGKITPLGWAMMLDFNNDKATRQAFERQCQKDPTLSPSVNKLFAIKIRIDSKQKGFR